MIGNGSRREISRELEPAVAIRGAHHGDLYALVSQSSHASRPLPFNRGLAFELEAELAEERDRPR